ncbi:MULTISPECIES: hypothetical protein [Subtercola]|uniref:Uncharacterized protein n=1 Tax=Subtercola vilae TaxID=2056433 RepID=A0A4T2CAE8_9MICO|nr:MULTISPECIES: hypothetical protein [Subtercola]MEA9986838.1 hypothetical protein [Subtercola sp. RTI3]TIH40351.1 hypothetical protein D4765_02015 [Subtercola vilae]
MAENGAQNEPVMAGSTDASAEEKVAGILAQARQDHSGKPHAEVLEHLRERFEQAEVEIDDVAITRHAHEITAAPRV